MLPVFDLDHLFVRCMAGLAALICAAVIAYLSLMPVDALPRVSWSDKVQHVVAYVGLSAPLSIALGQQHWKAAILLAVAYGGVMEIGQGTLSIGRAADMYDALANTLGACIGVGVSIVILSRNRTR